MSILENIQSPDDVKKLDSAELNALCAEIRDFLVESVSKTGGHLASNLGAVELTVALHRVFNTEKDRLVFDVGHQCYVHKLLTGRMAGFSSLRQTGGIAGFPKPSESVHDAFIAGHASNSISVALGMARARTLSGARHSVIALIGDGALTGGLAYEALSDAGGSGVPLIVILNDNGMSITKNVGGIARHLAHQRSKQNYLSFKRRYRDFLGRVPGGRALYRFTHRVKTAVKNAVFHCSMFEEMGFRYMGPVDGHDIDQLTHVLNWAKEANEPVLIHAITQKGRGYRYSEENPDAYHGVSKFDPQKGIETGKTDFSAVFGEMLSLLAEKEKKLVAVTAAMMDGTGLTQFAKAYPDRFFDVGIAEGHAVSMAAGAAAGGLIPVCAIYSTFLQRAYDQLIHDTAILGEHTVFAVDRAGLVGADGETHHGVFDVSYLLSVPGMTVMCPASFAEAREMLALAVFGIGGPVAVRYPRGGEGDYKSGGVEPSKLLREGGDVTLVTYGIQINDVQRAAEMLAEHNVSAEVIKLDFISPLDMRSIAASADKTRRVVVFEETAGGTGVGARIVSGLNERGVSLKWAHVLDLGTGFVRHGSAEALRAERGLCAEGIVRTVLEGIAGER